MSHEPETDLLVLVGAPDLGAALPVRAARTVCIEPDPVRALAVLRAHPGVTVIEAALCGEPGPAATLTRYNMPGLRALRPPEPALHALLPGLRVTGRQEVPRLDLAGLAARLGGWPARVALVVDLPGEETGLVAALCDDTGGAGLAARLVALRLRAGRAAWVRGARPAAALIAALDGADLVCTDRDAADPDWPVLRFAPDPVRRDLRVALERAAKTCDAAQAQADTLRTEAETLRHDHEAVQAEYAAETAALRDELAALQTARDAAQAQADTLRTEAETLRHDHEAVQAEYAAETAALRDEVAALQTARDAAQAQADTLRTEAETQTRAHSLVRAQATMLQADLADLQARFRTSEADRARATALLAALMERLDPDTAGQARPGGKNKHKTRKRAKDKDAAR